MNDLSAWFSVVCLWPIAAICLIGIFSNNYRDNWLQFLGLVGTSFWAIGRATVLMNSALEDGEVSFYQFLGHISILSYSVGTYWEVFHKRGDR